MPAYQKGTNDSELEDRSFVPVHGIIGWCDFDPRMTALNKAVFQLSRLQVHNPTVQAKCDILFQNMFSNWSGALLYREPITVFDLIVEKPSKHGLQSVSF